MFLSRYKKLCFVLAMVACMPVYAEETSSVPIGIKGKPVVPDAQVKIQVDDSLKRGNASMSAARNELAPDEKRSEIMGKKPATVRFRGAQYVPTEQYPESMSVQPGKPLTEADILADIRAIYMVGYYKDVSFSYEMDGDNLNVYFVLDENPLLSGIQITGTKLLNADQIAKALNLQKGSMVNMKDVGALMTKVTEDAKKLGYPVFTLKSMDIDRNGVLHLDFIDGIVDGFEISGNKITKPDVIIREVRQDIGAPLNSRSLEVTGQRLRLLGLFDSVDFKLIPSPSNPDHVKILIEVEEANNATIGLGAGYSETDGVTGQISIGDKNFLGRGDDIHLKWEFGGKTKRNYDFGYTRNYLDRKGTFMSVLLYDGIHESAEYDHGGHEIARFDKRGLGQEIVFGRVDGNYARNLIRLKNRKDAYEGRVGGYNVQYFEPSYDEEFYRKYGYRTTAEQRRKEDFGNTRSITFSRVYDNRNDALNPTRGKRNEVSFEWAGFGGDFNFRKLSMDQRYYWPLGKNSMAFDFAAGYAWGDMPLSQRFSVGGASTLRGYEDGQFRGNSMLRSSLEYRIPVSKRFSFLTFVDAGYAWDRRLESNFNLSDIKVGYGVGIRVSTPIGPVKLDYGLGKREEGSGVKGRFHISFGGNF